MSPAGRPGTDVLIAGAGIVGASIAWECARRGASVALVDRGRAGGEASGAAAGMLAPASEAHGPGAFLEMGLRSLAAWPAFAAGIEEAGGGDCQLALDGLLRVALDAADAAAVRARLDWQRAGGIEAAWLDEGALRQAEPALGPAVHGAGLYAREGHVHGPRTVAALLAALHHHGATVIEGAEVTGWEPAGAAVTLTTGQAPSAPVVVIAAGSWSTDLCTRLGLEAPAVTPVRGQLLALRGVEPPPRRVLFGGLLGYAVPKRDGTVLVGATEDEAGFDRSVTEAGRRQLHAVAARLLGGAAAATEVASWAGLRPRSADGLPILRELAPASGPGRPQVLLATGHHRNGVLLAPLTAETIADLALR